MPMYFLLRTLALLMAITIGFQGKRTGIGLNEQGMTSCSKYTNKRVLQHNSIKSACIGLELANKLGDRSILHYSVSL